MKKLQPAVLSGDKATAIGSDDLRELVRDSLEKHIPPSQLEEITAEKHTKLLAAIGEKRAAIANVLDRPVSATQLKYWGMQDGRPVYELKGVIAHSKFSGNRLSIHPMQRCMEEALRDRNAIIIVITSNPSLDRILNDGWHLKDDHGKIGWRSVNAGYLSEDLQRAIFSPQYLAHPDPKEHIYLYDDLENGGQVSSLLERHDPAPSGEVSNAEYRSA